MERAHMTNYLTDIDQKILDLWISSFLGSGGRGLKKQLGLVLNLNLMFWALAPVMSFWACGLLLNSRDMDNFDN